MTLKEQKYQNYVFIRSVLLDMETTLNQNGFRLYNLETVQELMKRSIKNEIQIVSLMDFIINEAPAMVRKTDIGYSISMISPKTNNEEDPSKDILNINTIEDIFRADGIINKAFIELVSET